MRPPVYANGRDFPFWAQYYPPLVFDTVPPKWKAVPWVQVRMKQCGNLNRYWPGGFKPITGKVDTGADLTVLGEPTAKVLGIDDITSGPGQVLYAANETSIQCYKHPVLVEITGRPPRNSRRLVFAIDAVFSADIKHDLFGRDWLRYVCIVMDHSSAHFVAG